MSGSLKLEKGSKTSSHSSLAIPIPESRY